MSSQEPLSLKEDLTCAICCDLFVDPVMLACMHHFCKACIATYWRGVRGPVTCPQCRQEFPTKQFQTNYLVAGMVEKVRARSAGQPDLQVGYVCVTSWYHVCVKVCVPCGRLPSY